jgi:hypothetical protein
MPAMRQGTPHGFLSRFITPPDAPTDFVLRLLWEREAFFCLAPGWQRTLDALRTGATISESGCLRDATE